MSRTRFSPHPFTEAFSAAEDFLARGRNHTSRPIQNNTRLVRIDDDTIAVVLHRTAVVSYHRDGTFTLYGGGWNTVTTKQRIRSYSPSNPGSDGNGRWIVGFTGEITAPNIQKCRTCKHRGRWLADDRCYGPGWYNRCAGPTLEYELPLGAPGWYESRYQVPCPHGRMTPHHTEPCSHGQWQSHITGQSLRTCHRCAGTGLCDYGSRPVPITVDPDEPYRVDADGSYLGNGDVIVPNLSATAPVSYSSSWYSDSWSAPTPAPPHIPQDVPQHVLGQEVANTLASVVPGLEQTVRHPITGAEVTVRTAVISLNDGHGWSREQIADWLDSLDVDLRFPTPATHAA